MVTSFSITIYFLLFFFPHIYSFTTLAVQPSNITTDDASLTTIYLPVYYSTLGSGPSPSSSSYPHFNDIFFVRNPSCNMEEVKGKIVVFVGDTLPMFSPCNNAHQAKIATFARLVQKFGGVALVVDNVDTVALGRVVGFSKSITIPVLVMPQKTKKIFQLNDMQPLRAFIPIMNAEEAYEVHKLRTWWSFMQIFMSILYGLLLLLVIRLFVNEIRKYKETRSIVGINATVDNLNISIATRAISIYSCVVSLLWCTVDPFGFHGILAWKNSLLINIHFSSVVIVFALILLMWNKAVGQFSKKQYVSYIIYAACTVVFLISVAFGFTWDNDITNDTFARGITALYVVLAIGFCIVGKGMLEVLYKGRSISGSNIGLILKIAIFIGWYFCICMTVVVVYSSGILGEIFQLMVTILAEALCLTGTFFVLFFQPFLKHSSSRDNSRNSRRMSNAVMKELKERQAKESKPRKEYQEREEKESKQQKENKEINLKQIIVSVEPCV